MHSFTLDGEFTELFTLEGENHAAVAYDTQSDHLWLVSPVQGSPIYAYDNVSNRLSSLDNPNIAITGLCFWEDNPSGEQLLALYQDEGTSQVASFNVHGAGLHRIANLEPSFTTLPRSCSLVSDIAPYGSLVFASPVVTTDGRVIAVWGMKPLHDWITLDGNNIAGVLQPEEETQITVQLLAVHLETGVYEAYTTITHTALSDPITIPITLTVTPEVSVKGEGLPLPDEFTITSLYPNPFNPRAVIAYSLPSAVSVKVEVMDINGRMVSTLVNRESTAGLHSVTWDASGVSAGVYLVRLTDGAGRVTVRKVVLVK